MQYFENCINFATFELTINDKTRYSAMAITGLFFGKSTLKVLNNLDMAIAIGIIVSVFLYFLPSWVGWKKRNANAIILLNFFLGWSIIGWIVALVWAATKE